MKGFFLINTYCISINEHFFYSLYIFYVIIFYEYMTKFIIDI